MSGLFGCDEGTVRIYITIGHARRVERNCGPAGAIEEDEAAGAFAAISEELHRIGRRALGCGEIIFTGARIAEEKIHGGFGHHNFHDGFAVAGAGNAACLRIGVATAADQRRIADAAGKFATRSSGGGGGEKPALLVDGNSADRSLIVAAVMFGGVFVFAAPKIGLPFRFANEFFGLAENQAGVLCEPFRTFGDQHHVRTFFQDLSREPDGIFQTTQSGCRAGPEVGSIHDDRVAFDLAIAIEMGAVARVEHWIVFQGNNRGFHSFERGATRREHGPAVGESSATAVVAGFDGFIGNVPGTTVNDQ